MNQTKWKWIPWISGNISCTCCPSGVYHTCGNPKQVLFRSHWPIYLILLILHEIPEFSCVSQGKITNLNNNTTYNTITKGTCQSNNLILFRVQLVPHKVCNSNQKQNHWQDSKVTYLTSNTITKPQWLDISIATMIIPIPVWLSIYLST